MNRSTSGVDATNLQPTTSSIRVNFRTSIEALVGFAVAQAEAEMGTLCIHDPIESPVLVIRRSPTGINPRTWNNSAIWGLYPMSHQEAVANAQLVSGQSTGDDITMPIVWGNQELGTLTLDFRAALEENAERAATVGRITDALARVLSLRAVDQQVAALAVRASRLEAELADSKISERVSGCKTDATINGRAPVDIIAAHVANVLSALHLRDELSHRVRRLEQELHKRDLLNEAKAVLQQRNGVSESEAYMQLQNESRRTRRPLIDVALAVIADQFSELHEMSA